MAFLALYLKAYDFYAPHNSELFVKGQKSRNAQSTFSNNLIQLRGRFALRELWHELNK